MTGSLPFLRFLIFVYPPYPSDQRRLDLGASDARCGDALVGALAAEADAESVSNQSLAACRQALGVAEAEQE